MIKNSYHAILILLLIGFSGCSRDVDWQETEVREGIVYEKGSSEPYTGKASGTESNGLESEAHYRDGILHGRLTQWYKNGLRSFEGEYRGGKQHGPTVQWYESGQKKSDLDFSDDELRFVTEYFENGQKKSQNERKNGQLHGTVTAWFENGQMASEEEMKNGELHGTAMQWFENGQMKTKQDYKNGQLDGTLIRWYESGQIQSEGDFDEGKQDGTVTQWFENGQKQAQAEYDEGKPDGTITQWFENGQKRQEVDYDDGKLDGNAYAWYENGTKKLEQKYKAGAKHGKFTQWFENGNKKDRGQYKDDKLHAAYTRWYESGEKMAEAVYEDGTLVERKEWDRDGNLNPDAGAQMSNDVSQSRRARSTGGRSASENPSSPVAERPSSVKSTVESANNTDDYKVEVIGPADAPHLFTVHYSLGCEHCLAQLNEAISAIRYGLTKGLIRVRLLESSEGIGFSKFMPEVRQAAKAMYCVLEKKPETNSIDLIESFIRLIKSSVAADASVEWYAWFNAKPEDLVGVDSVLGISDRFLEQQGLDANAACGISAALAERRVTQRFKDKGFKSVPTAEFDGTFRQNDTIRVFLTRSLLEVEREIENAKEWRSQGLKELDGTEYKEFSHRNGWALACSIRSDGKSAYILFSPNPFSITTQRKYITAVFPDGSTYSMSAVVDQEEERMLAIVSMRVLNHFAGKIQEHSGDIEFRWEGGLMKVPTNAREAEIGSLLDTCQ